MSYYKLYRFQPEGNKVRGVLITRKTQYQAVVERMLYEQKRHEDIRIEIIQMRPGDTLPTNQIIHLKYTDYEKIPTQITQIHAA